MAGEGVWPKVDGDILYGSEVTGLHDDTQDATDSNKGIATFDATDFTVTTGDVAINDSNTVRTVVAGEGIDVSSASGNPTISAEDATTSNKGIASFNTTDFAVSSGAVSLKSKTSYWSAPGAAFQPEHENTNYLKSQYGFIESQGSDEDYFLQVNLPHGAVITDVVVNGEDSTSTWYLRRHTRTVATYSNIANSNVNTASTSLTHSVNNSAFGYIIWVHATDNYNQIWGARITYTTDYD